MLSLSIVRCYEGLKGLAGANSFRQACGLSGCYLPSRMRACATAASVIRLPENCRWAAVFQEDRLLEHLDAWGNLHLIGTRQGEARAAAMLAELGLAETAERPVREYSGGMRRRLALIRALLAPSDALALDEPFSGLDDENRAVCRAVLQRETVGKPVLLVTHDEDDAAGLDARIIRLAPAR